MLRLPHAAQAWLQPCAEWKLCSSLGRSMEFLMGRSLLNALFNLDVAGQYGEALAEMGYSLERLVEQERDAVGAVVTPHHWANLFQPEKQTRPASSRARDVNRCL